MISQASYLVPPHDLTFHGAIHLLNMFTGHFLAVLQSPAMISWNPCGNKPSEQRPVVMGTSRKAVGVLPTWSADGYGGYIIPTFAKRDGGKILSRRSAIRAGARLAVRAAADGRGFQLV